MSSKNLIRNCRDCGLWIKKKHTSPQRGMCINTKNLTYEGNGCYKFVDRESKTKRLSGYSRECKNCGYDRCNEVTMYDGKALLCKRYINKNILEDIKKQEVK